MNDKIWARNLTTGQVVQVPAHYLTHPTFGKTFAPAKKGDKNYVPELYKAKVAGEPKASDEPKAEAPKPAAPETLKPVVAPNRKGD